MNPLKPPLIDEWSTREKLALASSVLTASDQNWYSASRSIKPFAELNRPHDWFSQKNCAIQYNELMEKIEKPKRKRGEKNEDTPQNLIVRKLTLERIEELKREIDKDREDLNDLQKNINLLKNDNLSETDLKIIEKQMLDALEQIKRDEEEHEKWLKQRAEKYAALNRKKSIVSAKTPRKDDQLLSTSIKTTPSTIVTPISDSSIDQSIIDSNKNVTPSIESHQEQLTIKQEKLTAQEQIEQQQIGALSPTTTTSNKTTTKEKSKDTDKVQITIVNEDKRQSIDKPTTTESVESKDVDKISNDKQDGKIDQSNKTSDKVEITVIQPVVEMEVDNVETIQKTTSKPAVDEKSMDKDVVKEEKEPIESIATNKRKRTSTGISSPAMQQLQSQQTTPVTQTRRSGRIKPLRPSTISKTEQSVEQHSIIAKKPISDEQTPIAQSIPISATQLLMNDDSTKDSTTSDVTDTHTSPNSPASSSIMNVDSTDPEQAKEQKEYKAWKKAISLLYREIATHKYATLFQSPVTDDDAKDYSSVVLKPIDLTIIKKKIDNGQLKTTAEFQRDIMLMFQNAIMYNNHQHEVHSMTLEMRNETLASIEDFINNQKNSSTTTKDTPSSSSRRKSTFSRQ